MPFPSNPSEGEKTVVNGIMYSFSSLPEINSGVWSKERVVAKGVVSGASGNWHYVDLSSYLSPGSKVVEISSQTFEQTDSLFYSVVLSKSESAEENELIAMYENVPSGGDPLLSKEILASAGSLYLGVLFSSGPTNNLSYRVDIQFAGKESSQKQISLYKTFPATCKKKVKLANNSSYTSLHDLTAQITGLNTYFVLNPEMQQGSLMLVLDGQVLKPNTGTPVYDYEIISDSEIQLTFVPEPDSQLIAMYVEKG